MKHVLLWHAVAVLVAAVLAGCGVKSSSDSSTLRGKPVPGVWEGKTESGDLCLRVRFSVTPDSTSIKDVRYDWAAKGQDKGMLTFPEQTSESPIHTDKSFACSNVTENWSVAPGVTVTLGGNRSFTISGAFKANGEAEGTVICPVTALGGPGAKEGTPPTRWRASPR
jgi:hypothetical protein